MSSRSGGADAPVRRGIPLLLGLMILAVGTSCGSGRRALEDSSAIVIAQVGDQPVSRRAFDTYLLVGLGDAEEVASSTADVKSRLLDQLLEEELLVVAARSSGLSVSDNEVEAFLPGNKGDIEQARRILLEKKYKEDVILKGISVSGEEIQRYFKKNLAHFRHPARVVLRKILLDSAHEARNVHSELVSDPDGFKGIAKTRSLSPDRGDPEVYEEADLPESIRKAIARLDPGDLSPVVEDPQGFFIVRLEQRQSESSQDLEEVRDEIKLKLLRAKSQQRFQDSMRTLRENTRLEIHEELLDFPYKKRGAS